MNYRSLSLLVVLSLVTHDSEAVSIQTLIDQKKIPSITGPADRRTLNLAGLKIDDLTGLSNIPGIDKVHVLILNRNYLKVIRYGDFSACIELQALGLRFNLLAKLEPGSFTKLSNLQAVRLGHNKLKTIPDGVFNTKLVYLGLAANPISKAERAKLQDKLPNTKIFFLPTPNWTIIAAVGATVATLAALAAVGRRAEKLRVALAEAASAGDVATMQRLLDSGVSDNDGKALRMAAGKGHYQAVTILLERDLSSVDKRNQWGETPLMFAATYGHEAIVRLLLTNGANIDAADNYKNTPLIAAAQRGNKGVVELLLKEKANVYAKNNMGWTALREAQAAGHSEIEEILRAAGAREQQEEKK